MKDVALGEEEITQEEEVADASSKLFSLQRLQTYEAWHMFQEEMKGELAAVEDLMTTTSDPHALFRLSGEARILRGATRWLENQIAVCQEQLAPKK